MTSHQPTTNESVFKRVLWLYGLFTLLSNAVYLFAYYLLPEGFMRDIPLPNAGELAPSDGKFWSLLAFIFLWNLGMATLVGILLNLFQVKGFSFGYLWLLAQGVVYQLVAATNSFVSSDAMQFNVRDGTALAMSIGGLEFLAYTLLIASTVRLGIYQFQSWWQLKPTKVMNLRDVRLSRAELLCLIGGILLLLVAAYREAIMATTL